MGFAVPPGQAMTLDEYLQLPEGPPYYELVDGELALNPPKNTAHQLIVGNLHVLLRAACPPEIQVMLGPFDWIVDDRNVFEPDLLVMPKAQRAHPLRVPPLLCVEVLSPSARSRDLIYKRELSERVGVASYWIIDPNEGDLAGPRFTALELHDGRYQEVADRTGDMPVDLTRPFPVTIIPAVLAD